MSQKGLLYLICGALVLGAAYFWTLSGPASPDRPAHDHKLFQDIDGQNISKIRIEQGSESVEIELKDGAWRLPARNGYVADSSKVRALLLKVFDMSVSQKIPATPDSFETLGVTDAAIKRGLSKLSFLDANGKLLTGIYVGEARKGSGNKAALSMVNGQYVRRVDQQDVYVVSTPVTASPNVASWLEANLVNVLQSAIYSIIQSKQTENGEELLFELDRSGEQDEQMKAPELSLAGGVPDGKVLQQSVVSQIRAGLENLRISDVFPVSAPEVKDVVFDMASLYKTTNGLVYHVSTGKTGEKYFAKLSVTFDQELAKQLQEENEKKQAEAKASPSATPTPKPSSAADDDDDRVPSTAPAEPPPLVVSSEDEAKKLSGQFAPWVYEVPVYQAKKLRNTKTELIEPPAPPPTPAPAIPPMPSK
jgi:hypothetical protein